MGGGGVVLTNLTPLSWPPHVCFMFSLGFDTHQISKFIACGMNVLCTYCRKLRGQSVGGYCTSRETGWNTLPPTATSHLEPIFSYLSQTEPISTTSTSPLPIKVKPNQMTTLPGFLFRGVCVLVGGKGYNNQGFVVENVAVGFPQGFLCTLLTGESHEGLAFHPPLLH